MANPDEGAGPLRVQFGEFTLDTETRELRRGDAIVHLSLKAFDLLALLAANRPRAIRKNEIMDRVWPEVFITDNTLATVVAEIRGALGDDPRHPRFVRTVHGYGYAFCGTISQKPAAAPARAAAEWRLVWDGGEMALPHGASILGRASPGVLAIEAETISRQHARVVVDGERATIEDLGSKNGTYVRDVRITGPVPIQDGDEVRLGSLLVTVRRERFPDSTKTA